MSEPQTAAPIEPAKAPIETPKPIEASPEAKTIPREEFDHVLQDLHKQKQERRALEEKIKALETSKLKENEDWKSLAELREKEADEARQEMGRLKEGLIIKTKFDALRSEALKNGIHESALDDLKRLDWPDVRIETTSEGNVNILGAERAIQRIKAQKPYLFKSPSVPNINLNSPSVVEGGEITTSMIFEAEKEAKKTGNYQKYHQLLKQYSGQQRQ